MIEEGVPRIHGDGVRLTDVPNAKESKRFGGIFGASGKGITEKENGWKILRINW